MISPLASRLGLIFFFGVARWGECLNPWLSLDEQVSRLKSHGLQIGERTNAVALLRSVGYHRLTANHSPFRAPAFTVDSNGRTQIEVQKPYKPGNSLENASQLIGIDTELCTLVLDGTERTEGSIRTQIR